MNKATFDKLKDLRRTLHQFPELAGEEKETASRVLKFFEAIRSDHVIKNLGGNGLAFIFEGRDKGLTSLYRCELDGLPIKEDNTVEYKSKVAGKAHLCGHDGHMAIIAGLGLYLSENRPQKGRVILLYQPAEETGQGAALLLNDQNFQKIIPDFAFALHNLPGHQKNQIIIKKGIFASASTGMIIRIKGKNSHASHPEDGNSPAGAMSKIILALQKLPEAMKRFTLVTVIHAKLGEVAFGTTPADATVMATLRAYDNKTRDHLVYHANKLCERIAKDDGLQVSFEYVEAFAATHNDEVAWEYGHQAAKNLNLDINHIQMPFRWSEDFGLFSMHTKTLLFGLGAGEALPQLHENNYDFPDDIIPTGVGMFQQIIAQLHH